MVTDKLGFNIKFAYGIGQAGEGMFGTGLSFFLLFYYSQILGMGPGLAASAIGIAVIVDAFSDVFAGSLSDHWQSNYGRRHPFMFASFLPLSGCFFFLFFPLVTSEWALFIWLAVFTNLARTMMSLYHVPHIALGAEITEDVQDRTALVAYRQFFANVGSLLALLVFFLVFSPFYKIEGAAGRFVPDAYIPWALCIAAAMALTIFWSAWGTRSVIPFLSQISTQPRLSLMGIFRSLFTDFKEVTKNKNFRYLFLGVLVVFIMVGVTGTLDIYMFTYFWELDEQIIVPVLVAYAIGNALGTFISVRLFSSFGKKACLIFGGLSWAFFQTLPVVLRLLDWFPDNGDTLLMPLLVALKVIQGFSTAQANVGYGSMMADVCDEHEYQTGLRQEGAFFAAVAFSAKATSGFGAVIAGWALEFIDWPTGPEIRTAADVDPDTLLNMGIFYGPIVAGLGFISVLFYTQYKLTPERHGTILVELAERRRSK
ncbi:MAG: MFS transporter [Pseudomonadales bacterium]|jgi:Na+/melibiose symporter-like transporter|nr:MFS transporter [Pseudomonadales bacterium]MDP7596449.1 MFS transporter [Pseudomonadales bacterium]HJN52824.1 MFS transporter [Pseudomonadales bacterium]|tara:strand:- start:1545 stop:2993 length:1449 start_codon:yes stop_codon:yes gene_type:complete